jgi:uncharacterized membrane protein
MFFSSRRRRGPDLHLDWKIRIFFAGALIAFIGMTLNSSIVVVVAIGVLLVGVLFRFLPGSWRIDDPDDGRESGEDRESAEDQEPPDI